MKKLIQKLFHSQSGFSLVEGMVAAGVIGGLALVVTHLGKESVKIQTTSDNNFAVMELTAKIQNTIANKGACKNSFAGLTLSPGTTTSVPSIRNASGGAVFSTGTKYANNKILISGMSLVRSNIANQINSTLKVVMSKANGASGTITKDFTINAKWTGNTIEDCSGEAANFIDTVVAMAVEQACKPNPNNLGFSYDPLNKRCSALSQFLGSTKIICDSTKDEVVTGLTWDAGTRKYSVQCKSLFNIKRDCKAGEFLTRDLDGNFRCVNTTCAPGGVFIGLKTDGSPNCIFCGSGDLPVFIGNTWLCKSPRCDNGKYFVGFNSITGDKVCNDLVHGDVCTDNILLNVTATGQVKLECCTPQCSNPQNRCIGSSYPADNSCGQCTGTRAAECSQAANFCAGEAFASDNGCGVCTGTKPQMAATWGPYVATGEYRVKSGAACSKTCGSGTIVTERKYTRSCLNNQQCNGASCTGVSEEWRDEGTQTCNTQSCTCTPTQTCAAKKAATCSNASAGSDSCGTSCGMGTKTAGCVRCYANWCHLMRSYSQVCYLDGSTGTRTTNGSCDTEDGGASGCARCGGGETTTTGGGGGCFIAGTQITMFSGEKKNIEDVRVGDELVDRDNKKVIVTKLIPRDYKGNIFGINGGGYFFTPNHPFLTTDGWKSLDPEASMRETPNLKVSMLKVGDILIKKTGVEVITSLDSIPTSEKVYTFSVTGRHEFVADDYIVHNKEIDVEIPNEYGL